MKWMGPALFLATLFIAALCGARPRFAYPESPYETGQNDQDLQHEIDNLTITFRSKALAEIRQTTPKQVGQAYYCSDCTNASVCVATGTVPAGFASMSGRTTACN